MKRDLIFVFLGGTLSGIFSAGVARTLNELNLYNKIHSFYATSSGAHSVAFFLSKNVDEGSTIYHENLIPNKLIKPKKLKFLWSMFLRTFNKNANIETLIDVDYLINIEKNIKKLNVKKISKSKIGFFVRVFNIKKKKEEWLDAKINVFKKLKATSALVPFYSTTIKINRQEYSDGDTLLKTIDPDLGKIIKNNPDKKVFLVFNETKKFRNSMETNIINIIWKSFLLIYFKDKFIFRKRSVFTEYKVLKEYTNLPNVIVIEPDSNILPFCQNKEKLLKFYTNGIEKTRKILVENGISGNTQQRK